MIRRAVGWLAFVVACGDPSEPSDLRPGGPPDVLAVLVNSVDHRAGHDGATIENATFCRVGDDKRPGAVGTIDTTTLQVCPDDLTKGAMEVVDAIPGTMPNVAGAETGGWYVRVMFDELLDPSIEDLVDNGDGTSYGTLQHTQPVVLICNDVNIPYDGYYSPSGNAETYPVGPSLFVAPLDPTSVPTGASCKLELKPGVVRDKQGQTVPAAELMPYTFAIEPIALVASSPATADPPEVVQPTAPVVLTFDAVVDPASLTSDEVILQEGTDCTTPTSTRIAQIAADPDSPTNLDIADAAAASGLAFDPSMTYIVTFAMGADVQDVAGGTAPLPSDFSLCFQTDVAQ